MVINGDIVFEVELIRQVEVNIDYILMLVEKYHGSHCRDKKIVLAIERAMNASPELRSKVALIKTFLAGITDAADVMEEWHAYIANEKEMPYLPLLLRNP